MGRACIALVLACSCGRIDFADIDARGPTEGGDGPLGPCTQWGLFGQPTRVVELGALGDDWAPSSTADGLEIYFISARAPAQGFDVFGATRTTPTGAFSMPVDRGDLSSPGFEHTPFISDDGLTMLLTSDRGGVSFDLYIATRSTRTDMFSTPVATPFANINSGNSEMSPWLSPDGLRLYFSSDRQGMRDVFFATRTTPGGVFAPPTPVAELNSPTAIEGRIALSHDELEAFITSNRGGDYDIYRSTRADVGSPFSTPVRVAELDSTGDDMWVSLQGSGDTVFYAYNAVAVGGNAEIWTATRPCTMH